jgi:hypothetical protein
LRGSSKARFSLVCACVRVCLVRVCVSFVHVCVCVSSFALVQFSRRGMQTHATGASPSLGSRLLPIAGSFHAFFPTAECVCVSGGEQLQGRAHFMPLCTCRECPLAAAPETVCSTHTRAEGRSVVCCVCARAEGWGQAVCLRRVWRSLTPACLSHTNPDLSSNACLLLLAACCWVFWVTLARPSVWRCYTHTHTATAAVQRQRTTCACIAIGTVT